MRMKNEELEELVKVMRELTELARMMKLIAEKRVLERIYGENFSKALF